MHGLPCRDAHGVEVRGGAGVEHADAGLAGGHAFKTEGAAVVGEGFEGGARDGDPRTFDVLAVGGIEDAAGDAAGGSGRLGGETSRNAGENEGEAQQ